MLNFGVMIQLLFDKLGDDFSVFNGGEFFQLIHNREKLCFWKRSCADKHLKNRYKLFTWKKIININVIAFILTWVAKLGAADKLAVVWKKSLQIGDWTGNASCGNLKFFSQFFNGNVFAAKSAEKYGERALNFAVRKITFLFRFLYNNTFLLILKQFF